MVTIQLNVELKDKDGESSSKSFSLSPEHNVSTSLVTGSGPVSGVLRAGASALEFRVGVVRLKNYRTCTSFLVSPFGGSERQRLTIVDADSQVAMLCIISGARRAHDRIGNGSGRKKSG